MSLRGAKRRGNLRQVIVVLICLSPRQRWEIAAPFGLAMTLAIGGYSDWLLRVEPGLLIAYHLTDRSQKLTGRLISISASTPTSVADDRHDSLIEIAASFRSSQ